MEEGLVKLQAWDPERKQGRLDSRCPGRNRGKEPEAGIGGDEAGIGRQKWVRTKKQD